MDEPARHEFAEFAAARSAELIRLAYVLTGSQHAAEDLLQTALTSAAARWGGYAPRPSPTCDRSCAAGRSAGGGAGPGGRRPRWPGTGPARSPARDQYGRAADGPAGMGKPAGPPLRARWVVANASSV